MFANYNSATPVINNYGNIVSFWNPKDLVKLKEIGWDWISWPIEKESTLCLYHEKQYYSTSIPTFFADWTFEQFEEQYTGQISLMEQSMQFLKTIKQGYKTQAEKQTREQYQDLFFQDNFAFPVADIYVFFNWRWDLQAKNQELFQAVTKELRNSDEY